MKHKILKFVFTIVIFTWESAHSTINVYIPEELENYVNKSSLDLCRNEMISLNFSNATIYDIGSNFISSPLITCLNLANNHIQSIAIDAFTKLPNLTNLFLSGNEFQHASKLFNFGGHRELKILILDNAVLNRYDYEFHGTNIVTILGEYPNLEILSVRSNGISDLQYTSIKSEYNFNSPWKTTQNISFPKLRILDLSENNIQDSNFVNLLSNNLFFLDLHDNSLRYLYLNKKGENLFKLNLDNNNLQSIYNIGYNNIGFHMMNLKNLHYLSICNNEIRDIESEAFRYTKLVYLNLSRNIINGLYPDTFANLQSLNTLDLSFNQFLNIPQISTETNITFLSLSCNKIKKIIRDAFVHMPRLTKLLLGGNQIDEIDTKAFAHLSVLEKMDLSYNKLTSLPQGWTESFSSLKYLDLSDNKFISLESLSLTSTLPLMEMYLVMNPLEFLNIRYFVNLPQNLTINLTKRSNLTYENFSRCNQKEYD